MKKKALVVGDDGINTLGLVRSLALAGYAPEVIVTNLPGKKVFLKKSKYLKNKCLIIDKDENVLVETLKEYNNQGEKIPLFPTSEFVLYVLGKHQDCLETNYFIPSVAPEIGSLDKLLSKEYTFVYAEKAGFTVPKEKTVVLDNALNRNELYRFFAGCYPLIAKGNDSLEPEIGFTVINTENELSSLLDNNSGKKVLIQQFIEKAEEKDIQCVGFGNNCNPVVCGVVNKIRTSVFAMGTTTYASLETASDLLLKEKCESFARLMAFSGLYDLEILIKDDKYYFIECNFRNGSNGYAFTKFGCNAPDIWIKSLNGIYPDDYDYNSSEKMYFINDIGDFAHVLNGSISPFKWINQYLTAGCRLAFNIKDIKPFSVEIKNMLLKRAGIL